MLPSTNNLKRNSWLQKVNIETFYTIVINSLYMCLLSLETDDADKGKILLDEEESLVVESVVEAIGKL